MPLDTSHGSQFISATPSLLAAGANPSSAGSSAGNKRKRERLDETAEVQVRVQQAPVASSTGFENEALPVNHSVRTSRTAGSQNGTWLENGVQEPSCAPFEKETIAPPRQKYQRRESSTAKAMSSPQAGVAGPITDPFTQVLGVGWTCIGSDPGTQAAARGWTKYIENHYRLSDVVIIMTSKAFEGACLVCARNGAQKGYFLFSEDLGQAKLVAYNWDICLEKLQSSPIAFENEEMLMAARTPTFGATRVGGACAMLPDLGLAGLTADDMMNCD